MLQGHHVRAGESHHVGLALTQARRRWLLLAGLAPVHLLVTVVTWRDLRRRSQAQVRGSRTLWRGLTASNVSWSAAYWLIGRRPAGVDAPAEPLPAVGAPVGQPVLGDIAGQFQQLAELHETGALTDKEFTAAKAAVLLASGPSIVPQQ